LYLAYLIPTILSNSFLALYLLTSLGMGMSGFLAFMVAVYCVGSLAVYFQRSLSPRFSFILAGFLLFAEFLLLAFPVYSWIVWIAAIPYGLVICYFWMVYNGLFFRERVHEKNATRSAYYYAIIYVIGVALPIAGILVINAGGFSALYLLASVLSLPFLYLASKQPDKPINFDFHRSFTEGKGYRTLAFLEGAISAAPLAIIPAVSVVFFPTPTGFGLFSAFFALAAVLAMVVLAKKSDALNKRKGFLIPLNILTAIPLFAAIFSADPFQWASSTAVFSFLYTLSLPLRNAVILDKKNRPEAAMANREFLLNAGRVACIIAGIALFFATKDTMLLLLPGVLATLGYAAVLKMKGGVS
ncbi:hypothetical protein HZC09_01990, partial [Candidatus Micrarchaeota archaeon]|nr:hypothetical protein [Candidatus Micrarchaeota archaeon]